MIYNSFMYMLKIYKKKIYTPRLLVYDDLEENLIRVKESNYFDQNKFKFDKISDNYFSSQSKIHLIIKYVDNTLPPSNSKSYENFTLWIMNNNNTNIFTDFDLFSNNMPNLKQFDFVKSVYKNLNNRIGSIIKNESILKYNTADNNHNKYTIVYDGSSFYKKSLKYKFLMNNLFETDFQTNGDFVFDYRLIPFKYKLNNLIHVKVMISLKIYINKYAFNKLTDGELNINILWLKCVLSHKNINITNKSNNAIHNKIINFIKDTPILKSYLKTNKNTIQNPTKLINESKIIEYNSQISNKHNLEEDNLATKTQTYKPNFENELKILEQILAIKPFNYQFNNMKWMYQLEENILNKKTVFNYLGNIDFVKVCYKNKNYLCQNINFKENYTKIKNKRISETISSNETLIRYESYINSLNFTMIPYNEAIRKQKYRQKLVLSGGILCDEVGLGKTLSAINLLLINIKRDLNTHYKCDKKTKYYANNLIIVPNRLVSQWYQRIQKIYKTRTI